MNRTARHLISSITVATLLVCSLPATASDNLGVRVATGVGRVIANQGNAALETIKDELKDSFLKTLKPLLSDTQSETAGEAITTASRQ